MGVFFHPWASTSIRYPVSVLKNEQTGEVIYEPPQDPAAVERLIGNFLEHFHRDEPGDPDPLVRMAVLHYQFESIHPFYDGNGRTGRILSLLHLVLHGLLDLPVLYLSRYIVRNKADYYRGLQTVRDAGEWGGMVALPAQGGRADLAGNAYQSPRNSRANAGD
jgi:Fic family protein